MPHLLKDQEGLQLLALQYFKQFVISKLLEQVPLDGTLKSAMISQLQRLADSEVGRTFFETVDKNFEQSAGITVPELIILVWSGKGEKELVIFKAVIEDASKAMFKNKLMVLAAKGATDDT